MKENKGGRPSKYNTHVKPHLEVIEEWAEKGLTDADIAKNLKISIDTFIEYKKKYAEFSEVLKRGKAVIDTSVENALLKRALGYEYDETTSEPVEGVMTVTKIVRKQVVPDVTAQIFWLKNRRPDLWRDTRNIAFGNDDAKITKIKIEIADGNTNENEEPILGEKVPKDE